MLSRTITINENEESVVLIEKLKALGGRMLTLAVQLDVGAHQKIKTTKSVRQVNCLKRL